MVYQGFRQTSSIPAKTMANDKSDNPEPAEIDLGRLGDFIGFRLRRIQNHLSRNFSTRNADWNLRSGLFSSLAIIAANPGISQNLLSREVGLDKSATVQIVDDLEARGWAERRRSPNDRRFYELVVTPAGQDALAQLFANLEETERDVMAHLSAQERTTLLSLLDRIYQSCFRL